MSRVICVAAMCMGILSALAGCTTGTGSSRSGGPGGSPYGSFRCDGGTAMEVRRASGSAIAVSAPNGESIVLPASPPGQSARYGADSYALVIEGPDALFMKNGDMPLNCRR
ncbi:MliC family protein [Notoacmeibacter sp. MSK16QG-6]|uniref:MliC family protein n=1 Tax=Notoacmeibacter sp. MSK16QG-6 TaxID=2957982 RepID=UPI00209D010B|nr:MliC family protein [Notoacmeibacter sp. MSK16QG-6]MCP1199199.1 MliC family protein [Notoacmeibacter sp. MSK16QG-6]